MCVTIHDPNTAEGKEQAEEQVAKQAHAVQAFAAVEEENVDVLRTVLDKIETPCCMHGCSIVGNAVIHNSVECLQLLLAGGQSLDVADPSGWTPLMRAAYHGRLECLQMLLDHGVSKHDTRRAMRVASYALWQDDFFCVHRQQDVDEALNLLRQAGGSTKGNNTLDWLQISELFGPIVGTMNLVELTALAEKLEEAGQSSQSVSAMVVRMIKQAEQKLGIEDPIAETISTRAQVAHAVVEELFEKLEVVIFKSREKDRAEEVKQKKDDEKRRRREEAAARRQSHRQQQAESTAAVVLDENGHFSVNKQAVIKSKPKVTAVTTKPEAVQIATCVPSLCKSTYGWGGCGPAILAGRDRVELYGDCGCVHTLHKSCARRAFGGFAYEKLCGVDAKCLTDGCDGRLYHFILRNDDESGPREEEAKLMSTRKAQMERARAPAPEPEPEP